MGGPGVAPRDSLADPPAYTQRVLGKGWFVLLPVLAIALLWLLRVPDTPRIERHDRAESAKPTLAEPKQAMPEPVAEPEVRRQATPVPKDHARITGIAVGPKGPVWGVMLRFSHWEEDVQTRLGETGSGHDGRFRMDVPMIDGMSAVQIAVRPDTQTRFRAFEIDDVPVAAGSTTTQNIELLGLPRLYGVVRTADGSALPERTVLLAMLEHERSRPENIAPGRGTRGRELPFHKGLHRCPVESDGSFDIEVPIVGNYLLFCANRQFQLESGRVRPDKAIELVLQPACGLDGSVFDARRPVQPVADVVVGAAYEGLMVVQVRFEADTGESFQGFGLARAGQVRLRWPRPAWWTRDRSVRAIIEARGPGAAAAPVTRTVEPGAFGTSATIFAVPNGVDLREFRLRVKKDGKLWNKSQWITATFHAGNRHRPCAIGVIDTGLLRIHVPRGAGLLTVRRQAVLLATFEIPATRALPDREIEIPKLGAIHLHLPDLTERNLRVSLMTQRGQVRHAERVWGGENPLLIKDLQPGKWTVFAGRSFKVIVRAGETVTLRADED